MIQFMEGALKVLASKCNLSLVVYGNMGEEWDAVAKQWMPGTSTGDDAYVSLAKTWASIDHSRAAEDAGGAAVGEGRGRGGRVKIIGGCCRTCPATIARLRESLCQ
jgi:S-methylmethionine-dependent homocysteine/selenocysteine methylase